MISFIEKIKAPFGLSILICILFIIPEQIFAQTNEDSLIDNFSTFVTYIEGEHIQKQIINGKEYQVFLKDKEGNTKLATNVTSGSGFFVRKNDLLYLVTAEHVANVLDTNANIVFTREKGIPISVPLRDIAYNRDWTFHSSADVAVILINPNNTLFTRGMLPGLPIAMLDLKLDAPSRQKEVTCIGFPLRLGVGRHFSAISTRGRTASGIIDLPRADNNKPASFFLLDAPSASGMSGGPAFTFPTYLGGVGNITRNDSITLYGLVHGVISDESGGKFSAIVPSSYIVETINAIPKYSGEQNIYYPNGKLWSKRIFKDGLLWEVISNYNKFGELQDKGTLLNGNGVLKLYNPEGQLNVTVIYQDGIPIKAEFLNK